MAEGLAALALDLTVAVVGVVPRLLVRTVEQFTFARAALDRLRCGQVEGDGSSTAGHEEMPDAASEPVGEPMAEVVPIRRQTARKPPAGAPAALAIPSYDDLAASQVIPLLGGLGVTELEAVRQHEAAGRQRRTILSRIAQLQAE